MFGNVHESSPSSPPVSHFKFDIDQQISEGLFYITAFAIMQTFRDNEKKTIKNDWQSAILNFIYAKFVMGYPCESPYILVLLMGGCHERDSWEFFDNLPLFEVNKRILLVMVQLIWFVFDLRKYHKITQMAILKLFPPKVN